MLIQKLRLQRGWSQQQLAELSGLSVRTIQRIERGDAASIETLKSLAAVFEVDFATLQPEPEMNETDPRPQAARPDAAVSADEALAMRHVRDLKRFYGHALKYAVVVAILFAVNYTQTPNRQWAIWVALGWGLGVLFHAARVFEFLPFWRADWERKQVEKRLGRPL